MWGSVAKKKTKRDWARIIAKGKRTRARNARAAGAKKNPPKMRKLTKSTAWLPATAVKIVKRRGQPDEVLIRRPGKKRTAKKRR
jgi:hypothetical protein